MRKAFGTRDARVAPFGAIPAHDAHHHTANLSTGLSARRFPFQPAGYVAAAAIVQGDLWEERDNDKSRALMHTLDRPAVFMFNFIRMARAQEPSC